MPQSGMGSLGMAENQTSQNAASQPQDKFLEKLRKALVADGDFPASAKIVGDLKRITAEPNASASQIAEIILRVH